MIFFPTGLVARGGDVGSPTGSLNHSIDLLIKRKVEFIKQHLQPGMTKEEVIRILGDGYKIANDNGDLENGSDGYWKYRFFMQPGYVSDPADHVIDEAGLSARKVGADLFIGWKRDRLYLYSIAYPQGEHLYFYIVRPDGTSEEKILR